MRVRVLTAVLTAVTGSAFAADPELAIPSARVKGSPLELNKPGVRAVVAWGGRTAEIAFGGPGKPATGVFDGATTFVLDPARAAALQAAFAAGRVADLPTKVGGIPGRSGRIGPNDPPPLVGWVAVREGDTLITNVNQLGGGVQSKELARFAAEVLGACEASAKVGARATDLADGLAKVQVGHVPATALSLNYSRVPPPDWGDEGVALTIEDGVAVARRWQGSWEPARRLELSAKDVADIAKAIAAAGVSKLGDRAPSQYPTHLDVQVLGCRKTVTGSSDDHDRLVNRVALQVQLKRAGMWQADQADDGDPFAPLRDVHTALNAVAKRVLAEGKPTDAK